MNNKERTYGIMFAIGGFGLYVCVCMWPKILPTDLIESWVAIVAIILQLMSRKPLVTRIDYFNEKKKDGTKAEPMGICMPYEA